MIFLLVIIFIIIGIVDLPKLIKKKQWYDLSVFSIFFLFAFTTALLQTLGVPIPSPVKGAEFVIKDVLHLNYD